MFQLVVKFGDEFRILAVVLVGRLQFIQGMNQRFGNEHATVRAKMTLGIGKFARKIVDLHVSPLK